VAAAYRAHQRIGKNGHPGARLARHRALRVCNLDQHSRRARVKRARKSSSCRLKTLETIGDELAVGKWKYSAKWLERHVFATFA
jgi:hypothetical protein